MMNIVLFEPEIPMNTGNIIRLAANTGFTLHLIRPYGFVWDDKKLSRSALDYEEFSDIKHHDNWNTFLECIPYNAQVFAMTTKCSKIYTDVTFYTGDFLLFGPESRGLPEQIRNHDRITSCLKLPMLPNQRSINLSNSVAISCFEAWRQSGFNGGV